MKKTKLKIKTLLALTGGVALAISTPIAIVSCSNNNNSSQIQNAIKPILKDSLKISGGLAAIGGKSGTKTEIQKNLNDMMNGSKSSIVSNYSQMPKEQQNALKIEVTVKDGSDAAWGKQTFKDWSNGVTQEDHKKPFKGFGQSAEANAKITIKSKDDLKKIFEDNKVQIAKNAGIATDSKKVALADAEIGLDGSTVQIGLEVTNASAASKQSSITPTVEANDKYIIQIQDSNINMNIATTTKVTNGNQSTSGDISFSYQVNTNEVEQKLEAFKDIELAQKENDQLYTTVSNNDILNALGWNKKNTTKEGDSTPTVDENTIDITFDLLNEEQVKKDLKLSDKDDLLAIRFLMEQRDPSKENFNGEYKIEADVIDKTNTDQTLAFKTYKFFKNISEGGKEQKNKTYTQFQLNVPNAYILDTILPKANGDASAYEEPAAETDDNIYRHIDLAFMGTSFVMGSNGVSLNRDNQISEDANTKAIKANLEKSNTFNKFIKTINDRQITLKKWVFNGLTFTLNDIKKHNAITNEFSTIISLNFALKKGFTFKTKFAHNNVNYNVDTANKIVKFGINYGSDNSKAIKLDNKQTPDQVNQSNSSPKP